MIEVFGCSIGEFGCRGVGVSGIVELMVGFFYGDMICIFVCFLKFLEL